MSTISPVIGAKKNVHYKLKGDDDAKNTIASIIVPTPQNESVLRTVLLIPSPQLRKT